MSNHPQRFLKPPSTYLGTGVGPSNGLQLVSGQTKLDTIHTNIQKQLAQAATFAKGCAVLVCLLGISWILGILYVSRGTKYFAYLFTTVNSLQGFFIFIFHCILNEKVRYEFDQLQKIDKQKLIMLKRRAKIDSPRELVSEIEVGIYIYCGILGNKIKNCVGGDFGKFVKL